MWELQGGLWCLQLQPEGRLHMVRTRLVVTFIYFILLLRVIWALQLCGRQTCVASTSRVGLSQATVLQSVGSWSRLEQTDRGVFMSSTPHYLYQWHVVPDSKRLLQPLTALLGCDVTGGGGVTGGVVSPSQSGRRFFTSYELQLLRNVQRNNIDTWFQYPALR